MLRVERKNGTLLAVVWGISCYPTEWPGTRELSADYPGLVREALRDQISCRLPVLFLQGFCGDLRPPALGRWLIRGSWRVRLLMFLCSLINGPFFAGFSPIRYERWADRIVQSMYSALAEAANREPLPVGLTMRRMTMPLSEIGLSAELDELAFHIVEIGGNRRFCMCVSRNHLALCRYDKECGSGKVRLARQLYRCGIRLSSDAVDGIRRRV
jgi:hypothetical protein